MHIIDDIPFHFETDNFLRKMRVNRDDTQMVADIDRIVEEVRAVAKPRAAYREAFVENCDTDSVTIDGVTFPSRVLSRVLENTERVFAYVATCGVEADAVRVTNGDPLLEYFVDMLKEMLVECAYEFLRNKLEMSYQSGELSNLSPGSIDAWPVSGQREMFTLLGDTHSAVGVQLNDSCLMIPVKSVSGLCFSAEKNIESCKLCSRTPCRGRRAAYDKEMAAEFGVGES
jgi:hypothetical protein